MDMHRAVQSAAVMAEKTSTLPSRNPWFVGQKPVLREIRQKLDATNQTIQAVALIGLGGAGYLTPILHAFPTSRPSAN